MTKAEFLAKLRAELEKNKANDVPDIISEYEQHFSFKLADGFSEEEICVKLGDPALLASQFETSAGISQNGGLRVLTVIGLFFTDLFYGLFYMLLCAWGVVMAVFSLACASLSVCLFGGLNIHSLIPPAPYFCGAVFALSFAALAVLAFSGTVFYAAFLRGLMRSFGRFQHNVMASASGKAVLPPLSVAPRLAPKVNRRLRKTALISLSVFAACFILGMIISMLCAGDIQFWHAWGWFGQAK